MSKFNLGQSGNPGGRPKLSLNKTTLATQALLDGEAEALTRKVVELGKNGNRWRCGCVWKGSCPRERTGPLTLTCPVSRERRTYSRP